MKPDTQPVTGPPFKNEQEAAEFYGLKWRGWMQLRALGKSQGDPLPSHSPRDMPGWFDRMRAAGVRKHKTPQSILDRAAEGHKPTAPKTAATRRSSGKSTAGAGAGATVPPPQVAQAAPEEPQQTLAPLTDDAAENDTVETFLRRELDRLKRQYERELGEGKARDAKNTKAEFFTTSERLRAWEKDKKQIRAGEAYLAKEHVHQAMGLGLAALWRAMQREVCVEFSDDDRKRVLAGLSRAAERAAQILPKELYATPAPAAAGK